MKLWAGRFGKATDSLVDDFHSSISFDQRLFEQDIAGSAAHARMMGEQGIIPREDAERIIEGLEELRSFHPAFDPDVFGDLSLIACVEKRRIPGAPAPEMVQAAIDSARKKLAE